MTQCIELIFLNVCNTKAIMAEGKEHALCIGLTKMATENM